MSQTPRSRPVWAFISLFGSLIFFASPWVIADGGGGRTPDGLVQAQEGTNKSLTGFTSFTIVGNYVAGGVGLRGSTSGDIHITGIPTGATVEASYLYWSFLDNGPIPQEAEITLNGTAFTGMELGSGPDTCWFRSFSRAFLADVTRVVTGNGIYTVRTGAGGSLLAQGSSLVVVYAAPTEKVRTIVITHGNDVVRIDDLLYGPPTILSQTNTLEGFTAADPGTGVQAKTTFIIGDGQPFNERVTFTAGGGTVTFDNSFGGSDGLLWDTDTHDVSAAIAAGDTVATASLSIPGPDGSWDCLNWVAQVLAVSSATACTPSPHSPRITEAFNKGNPDVPPKGLCCPSETSCIREEDINGDGGVDCLQSEYRQNDCGDEFPWWCMQKLAGDTFFGLTYQPRGGSPRLVGKCPFDLGKNSALITHTGDANVSGKVDAFIGTNWVSSDENQPLLSQGCGGRFSFDPLPNKWVYDYDVASDAVVATCYRKIPPYWWMRVSQERIQTPGALFNAIPPRFDGDPEGPMSAVDREPCDLNWDGRCDSTDLRMFEAVFGHCDTDGYGIIPEADMDRDGCITEADRRRVFRGAQPSANAGPDQTTECTGNLHAAATLDGSRSSDSDGDPLTFSWTSAPPVSFDMTVPSEPTASFPLGMSTVTLVVNDGQLDSDPATTHVTVQDTLPPAGSITFPTSGGCYGSDVTVLDSFVDICNPNITRTYDPAPGPGYSAHGDYHVTLTAKDGTGNVSDPTSVEFTIDLVAPTVTLYPPAPGLFAIPFPTTLRFSDAFSTADNDGATADVVREKVFWDGCLVFDGASYGNKDGLLTDETIPAKPSALCRVRQICGKSQWTNPVLRVEATDCGGNVGVNEMTVPGSFALKPGDCAKRRRGPSQRGILPVNPGWSTE